MTPDGQRPAAVAGPFERWLDFAGQCGTGTRVIDACYSVNGPLLLVR